MLIFFLGGLRKLGGLGVRAVRALVGVRAVRAIVRQVRQVGRVRQVRRVGQVRQVRRVGQVRQVGRVRVRAARAIVGRVGVQKRDFYLWVKK